MEKEIAEAGNIFQAEVSHMCSQCNLVSKKMRLYQTNLQQQIYIFRGAADGWMMLGDNVYLTE